MLPLVLYIFTHWLILYLKCGGKNGKIFTLTLLCGILKSRLKLQPMGQSLMVGIGGKRPGLDDLGELFSPVPKDNPPNTIRKWETGKKLGEGRQSPLL